MNRSDPPESSKQIRVVEDEQSEPVRLEKAGDGPKKRLGIPSVEEASITTMMGDEDDRVVLDPEDEWKEESSTEGHKPVPMGWFVLIVALLLGIIAWAVLPSLGKDDPSGPDTQEPGPNTQGSAVTGNDNITDEEAEKYFAELERVLDGFLSAPTIEERAKWIRHPSRVLPLMEEFYETNPFTVFELEEIVTFESISLENRPFIALDVSTDRGPLNVLLLEEVGDSFKMDWEVSVGYQPQSISEILKERPTEPIVLRSMLSIAPYKFSSFEFNAEDGWIGFQIDELERKEWLWGYVKEDSIVGQEIRKLMGSALENSNIQKKVILKIRYLEGSRAPRSVEITELVSPTWAFASNPDEETPADKPDED